uniref:Uncharacterized protein n=1 Tax=Onchocerca volvulus TaxID=6282 RepID=A0A8R1XPT4_ONCVO
MFDPLGLLCPVIVLWKMLVQNIWQNLDIFVDALKRVIGVVIYARREISKKRGSTNSVTVPRLELLEVALGKRIIEFLRQESIVENAYQWTDSACAIH